MEPDAGYIWVTPKIRELFHFDPGEALNYESFIETTHPDDRDGVNEAVLQAPVRRENAVRLPDHASGRKHSMDRLSWTTASR